VSIDSAYHEWLHERPNQERLPYPGEAWIAARKIGEDENRRLVNAIARALAEYDNSDGGLDSAIGALNRISNVLVGGE
jgi:hypothetical protein